MASTAIWELSNLSKLIFQGGFMTGKNEEEKANVLKTGIAGALVGALGALAAVYLRDSGNREKVKKAFSDIRDTARKELENMRDRGQDTAATMEAELENLERQMDSEKTKKGEP
jgi:hypothetical protein